MELGVVEPAQVQLRPAARARRDQRERPAIRRHGRRAEHFELRREHDRHGQRTFRLDPASPDRPSDHGSDHDEHESERGNTDPGAGPQRRNPGGMCRIGRSWRDRIERERQIARRLEAIVRILLEAAPHNQVQGGRHRRIGAHHRGRIGL
jgi:hypothetical protein